RSRAAAPVAALASPGSRSAPFWRIPRGVTMSIDAMRRILRRGDEPFLRRFCSLLTTANLPLASVYNALCKWLCTNVVVIEIAIRNFLNDFRGPCAQTISCRTVPQNLPDLVAVALHFISVHARLWRWVRQIPHSQ